MTADALNLTHIATFHQTLGGLQAVVRHHLATDQHWQKDSRLVTLFEAIAPSHRVTPLGLTGFDSIRIARHRFQPAMPEQPCAAVVYHDFWGLPFLADLDRAHRRLGMIHCPAPEVLEMIARHHGLLDGILCVSEPSLEAVRRSVPGFPADRVCRLPLPVCPPTWPNQRAPLANREFVLGYSGRLIKAHKRVDRLPRLLQVLTSLGLNLRLEILGDGPARKQLERAFRNNPAVVFHGCQQGERYWQVIRQWDAIIYVSDLEGLGLSLLEAMSVGVLPLYPRIGGAESYAAKVRADFLYQPDDFFHLAEVIRSLRSAPETEVQSLRLKCCQAIADHLGSAYQASFTTFVKRIRELPRQSKEIFSSRPAYPSDFLPFGILRRFYKRGFLLGNRE